MITIDASSAPGGLAWDSWFSYVGGTGDYKFFGGTPDQAFGGTYYMNGSQLLFTHGTEGQGIMLEGEGLAYDFMHYGPSYGHGLSGRVDRIVLGNWVEGETSGTEGIGEEGRVSGFETWITISGLDIDVAPRTGNVADNVLQGIYNGLLGGRGAEASADALLALLQAQGQKFIGSDHADSATGTRAADWLLGGGGNDKLYGGMGADTLEGGDGRDRLEGGMGADVLYGGAGGDRLLGGGADDRLYGGDGDDRMFGGNGNDSLYGGRGADVLRGGTGDDVLQGGMGADTLYGGAGADTFVFADAKDSIAVRFDTIADFNALEGDRIDVSALGEFNFIGAADFSGSAGELRFGAVEGGTRIEGDLDGDGQADLVIFAVGDITFTAGDFIL